MKATQVVYISIWKDRIINTNTELVGGCRTQIAHGFFRTMYYVVYEVKHSYIVHST